MTNSFSELHLRYEHFVLLIVSIVIYLVFLDSFFEDYSVDRAGTRGRKSQSVSNLFAQSHQDYCVQYVWLVLFRVFCHYPHRGCRVIF